MSNLKISSLRSQIVLPVFLVLLLVSPFTLNLIIGEDTSSGSSSGEKNRNDGTAPLGQPYTFEGEDSIMKVIEPR